MKEKLQELFKPDKLMALTKKEVLELIRNKYLVFLILIPPVVQLLILCAALDPRVNDLNLSVVDNSSTALSRSLITKLIDTTVFTEPNYLETREALLQSMKEGNSSTDVGIVISPDFAEKIRKFSVRNAMKNATKSADHVVPVLRRPYECGLLSMSTATGLHCSCILVACLLTCIHVCALVFLHLDICSAVRSV